MVRSRARSVGERRVNIEGSVPNRCVCRRSVARLHRPATVGCMVGDVPDGCSAGAVGDERYLHYVFGDHPMNPVRLDLTMRLARELGVLERLTLLEAVEATDDQL